MQTTTLRLTGELEPRDGWEARHCSVARALDVMGTRSAFLLLREAFYGTTRFDAFAKGAGVSEPVVAARLRELVDAGLLEREDYREPGQRTRQSYRLTQKGLDLFPAIVALMQWGDRWIDDQGGPIVLEHRGCGEEISTQIRCTAGHEVRPGDVDASRRRGWRRPAAPPR